MRVGVGPCKDCKEREEYVKKGMSCHAVCEKYKKFDEENKLIRQKRTESAIFNSIRKDSYSKPTLKSSMRRRQKKG